MTLEMFDGCMDAIADIELEKAAETSAMARAILDQKRQVRQIERGG